MIKKKYYNKLIRDKVPNNMKQKGVAFHVSTLNQAALKRELLKKVGEEASSLPGLRNRQQLAEELGDILDVIDEVQRVFKITTLLVRQTRRQAAQRKGGFKKRIYLHWSADSGYRTNERTNSCE